MTIVTSKIFRSGNSQAVRLPREVAYPENMEVTIERSGDVLTIRPKRMSLAEMFRQLAQAPGPGSVEVRDTEEIPERPGL